MSDEEVGQNRKAERGDCSVERVSRRCTQAGDETDETSLGQRSANAEQADGSDRSRNGQVEGKAFQEG